MRLGFALATGIAALAVVATAAQRKAPLPVEAVSATAAFGSALPAAECPPGSLPDHGVCVPVPQQEMTFSGPRAAAGVPRRPDRPPELSRYVLPVVPLSPDEPPAGLPPLRQVLPEGIEQHLYGFTIPAEAEAEVRLVALEGQKGDATVAYAGDLVGPTFVSRHVVEQQGESRVYLLFFGNLSLAPVFKVGATVAVGAKIGSVGEILTPGQPRLYLELRQTRADFEPTSSPPDQWLDPAYTISVDVRNALTLAKKP